MRIKLALTIEIGRRPQPVEAPVDQGTVPTELVLSVDPGDWYDREHDRHVRLFGLSS